MIWARIYNAFVFLPGIEDKVGPFIRRPTVKLLALLAKNKKQEQFFFLEKKKKKSWTDGRKFYHLFWLDQKFKLIIVQAS